MRAVCVPRTGGEYESWTLPAAIILVVPMCLLAAISGVFLRSMDNNIFTQIGLVVLVGLACKNAILIVEYAKQQMDAGVERHEAAVEACRLRLRPILMTSFAFSMGVWPLVIALGAGSEMRQALGTTVFTGMLGVTFFGIFLTPVFFSVIMKLFGRKSGQGAHTAKPRRRARRGQDPTPFNRNGPFPKLIPNADPCNLDHNCYGRKRRDWALLGNSMAIGEKISVLQDSLQVLPPIRAGRA